MHVNYMQVCWDIVCCVDMLKSGSGYDGGRNRTLKFDSVIWVRVYCTMISSCDMMNSLYQFFIPLLCSVCVLMSWVQEQCQRKDALLFLQRACCQHHWAGLWYCHREKGDWLTSIWMSDFKKQIWLISGYACDVLCLYSFSSSIHPHPPTHTHTHTTHTHAHSLR